MHRGSETEGAQTGAELEIGAEKEPKAGGNTQNKCKQAETPDRDKRTSKQQRGANTPPNRAGEKKSRSSTSWYRCPQP